MKKTKSFSFDLQKFSSIVANFCQFGILALAVFGYFYTVRPVYQNQKLNEENAKLLTENEKIKNDTIILQQKIQPLSEKIQILQQKNTSLENQYSLTYQKLINLQQEKALREREERIIKDKEEIIVSINEFKNELYNSIGETRTGKEIEIAIAQLTGNADANIYLSRLDDIEQFMKDYFYDPYDYIEAGIENLQENCENNTLEKQRKYLKYCDYIKRKVNENKAKYVYDETIVSQIYSALLKFSENKKIIEREIKKETNGLRKIQTEHELFSLKMNTLNLIRNKEKELIDYTDILNPAIDEMVKFYIDEYMKKMDGQ